MVQEDGSLVWGETGEPVEGLVGFVEGTRLLLVTPNGHHEIAGVQLSMPQALKDARTTKGAWRAAMFRRRAAIETKLTTQYDALRAAEPGVPLATLRRIEKVEKEAREYNALAEEMGLPLVRVEIRD